MQLRDSTEDLMRSDDYASPQVEAGRRPHGGFDSEGNYLWPRTRVRCAAIEAFAAQLRERGGDLVQVDSSLARGVRYPSYARSVANDGAGWISFGVPTAPVVGERIAGGDEEAERDSASDGNETSESQRPGARSR